MGGNVMERLLIFTGGVSLLENLLHPWKQRYRPDLVEGLTYKQRGAWRTVLRRARQVRNELATFAGLFASLDLATPEQRSCATAEAAAFYLLRAGQPAFQDRLVLLCSDTGQGAFCALANAMLLGREVRYYPQPGYYLPLPDCPLTLPGLVQEEVEKGIHPSLQAIRLPYVEVVAVRNLDAARPDKFERHAIPALIQTIAQIHYNRSEEETILNYTAGFKAAIPTLTQAAAIADNISIKCLYEDASALITQPVIQIRLEPSTEKRLTAPSEGDGQRPGWPEDGMTLDALKNRLPQEEWSFYEEAASGGVQFSSLGLAMRELLQAKHRASRMQP
jgi:hypothetical protein